MTETKRQYESAILLGSAFELRPASKPSDDPKVEEHPARIEKERLFQVELIDRVIKHIKKL